MVRWLGGLQKLCCVVFALPIQKAPPKGLLKQHQKSSKRILFQASPTGRKALALVTAKGLRAMRSTRMGHVGFRVCHICDCCCYCAGRLLPANPYRYSSSNGCTHLLAATLNKTTDRRNAVRTLHPESKQPCCGLRFRQETKLTPEPCSYFPQTHGTKSSNFQKLTTSYEPQKLKSWV